MSLKKNNFIKNFDSSRLSWLKSGGRFKNFIKINDEKELLSIQNISNFKKKKIIPIGNFSNLLVRDEGFDGLAIKLVGDFSKITIEKDSILVGAGVLDRFFSQFCYRNKISGYEFLHTIPGSIGGNIFMNAGCYGEEIRNKLISIIFLDFTNYTIQEIEKKNLKFDYRKGFQKKNTLILYGKFNLSYGNQDSIKNLMKDYEYKRNSSQPQKVNCCGSIFKNPPGINAWQLIKSSLDDNFYNGPIKLSKKHSNFFENEPNMSANQIISFISSIKNKVYEKHQINLEPELDII